MAEDVSLPHPLEGDRQIAQCIFPTHQVLYRRHGHPRGAAHGGACPPTALRLVHAICLLPDEGTPFAHAWVERGTACLFVGLYRGARVLCSVERPAHYEHLRVQHRTKYTPWQAARENQRTVSYGPWKPQYRALIRQ